MILVSTFSGAWDTATFAERTTLNVLGPAGATLFRYTLETHAFRRELLGDRISSFLGNQEVIHLFKTIWKWVNILIRYEAIRHLMGCIKCPQNILSCFLTCWRQFRWFGMMVKEVSEIVHFFLQKTLFSSPGQDILLQAWIDLQC